jgi:hypothetical protein
MARSAARPTTDVIKFIVDLALGNLRSPLSLHKQTMLFDQARRPDGRGRGLICTQSLLNDLDGRHSGTLCKLCCTRSRKHGTNIQLVSWLLRLGMSHAASLAHGANASKLTILLAFSPSHVLGQLKSEAAERFCRLRRSFPREPAEGRQD